MPNRDAAGGALVTMQGIQVPRSSVNPEAFFHATRRQVFPFAQRAYAGFGVSDAFTMLKTGVVAGVNLKFSGSLVIALPTGTCASTARWPYDMIKAARFSANGQSNLINVSGQKLRIRDLVSNGDLTDRGVSQGIGGASPGTTRTQGTLSLASESWGVGSNVSAIPAGTYSVELEWFLPVAMDQRTLIGAIFAQTTATELSIQLDYAPQSDLFTLTGTATATLTGTITPEVVAYSIPQGPDGDVVVPDLSQFHQLIQVGTSSVANGANDVLLVGQGVGRQLMRIYGQLWNGTPQAPVPLTAANFANIGWRFGGNDTPEDYATGQILREFNERLIGSDIGGLAGCFLLDWCNDNAFRDSIDEGAATELRLYLNLQNALSLSNQRLEYVQETLFAGAVGA